MMWNNFRQTILGIILSGMIFLRIPCFAEEEEDWMVKKFPAAFPPETSSHVYDVIQDRRGLMYFATELGVLEYDGVTWRTIAFPEKGPALAFGTNQEGRLFTCGARELGYLVPDESGKMYFKSLLPLLKEKELFTSCFQIQGLGKGATFAMEKGILHFDGQEFKMHATPGTVHAHIVVNEQLYVVDSEAGLLTLTQGALVKVPNGNFFRTTAMAVTADKKVIVATQNAGLLSIELSPEKVHMEELPHQDVLLFNRHAVTKILPYEGHFYVGMAKEGLVNLTATGARIPIDQDVREQIGQDVFALFHDREGNLWLGSETGITMINRGVPVHAKEKEEPTKFIAMVRSLVSTKDESMIFGGTYFQDLGGVATEQSSELNTAELPFDVNALRFNFASNSVGQGDEVEYQTFLEGFDTEWTAWSKRSFREFTNLFWDTYTFKVKAKRPDGVESGESTFSFRIVPPWYESWWFFGLQLFSLYLLMVTVVILRFRTVKTVFETQINGIVCSTVFGYAFTKLGAGSAVDSLSGGAAFLSVLLGSVMGIFLNPLQHQFGLLILKVEHYMERLVKKYNLENYLQKAGAQEKVLQKEPERPKKAA